MHTHVTTDGEVRIDALPVLLTTAYIAKQTRNTDMSNSSQGFCYCLKGGTELRTRNKEWKRDWT